MSFIELVEKLFDEKLNPGRTLWSSLAAFRPELVLCATIVAILLARIILPRWKNAAYYLMLFGSMAAVYSLLGGVNLAEMTEQPRAIFDGLLLSDGFSIYMRGMLLIFALLFTSFTLVSGVPKPDEAGEFYVLTLGAVLGMSLMVAANHLVIVMLGMEMASVPSYVLAGLRRNQRRAGEAALKYAVYGAGAAGIMLFGMSLLAGVLGSAHLPTMGQRLAELLESGAVSERSLVLILGGLMLIVGVGFKLAAVPFHFWMPDVFEGATAEVAAFLSVASKAAALALLVRLVMAFSFVPDPVLLEMLAPVRNYLALLLALLAAVTCTFGNLAAYGQRNMKRLLAYSTIAHAGYMLMPIVAAVTLIGHNLQGAREAVAALLIYISIYLFMNLAAFCGTAFLRNAAGTEEIDDFSGLVRRSPGFTICMAIAMFSLLGLPPLSGFVAKVSVFIPLIDARLFVLLAIALFNTVLSLFYYLRVVKVMTLHAENADRPLPAISLLSVQGFVFAMLTVPVVALFFLWGGLSGWAQVATQWLVVSG
ncbi:MAG: NADH-quinone oxidoreductase subunit N [Thermoguttaceae bacterium]